MTVTAIKQEYETLGLMVRELLDKYPNCTNAVVTVWDEEGGMHTLYHCNAQQMALAAVRLIKLAND